MYAMKIVLPKGEESEDSSRAEAETLARGCRRLWRYSAQDFRWCSVWKIHYVTSFFVSNHHCIYLWLGYDPFYMRYSVVQHGVMSIARTVV